MRTILAAILCVLTINGARADSHHFALDHKMVGLYVTDVRPIPPALQRVMAEGAERAAGHRGERWVLTCDDIRAIVNRVGESQAVAVAQAYGAGPAQIEVARQCLTKKVRK